MNFMEAVEEMKKGNKVRHKNSEKISDNFYYYYDKESNRVLNGFEQDIYMDLIMIGATDWEVLEEESDWNLVDSGQNFESFNNFSYAVKNVKKCRDLIIKELDEDLANDSGVRQSQRMIWHNWFKKIVNKRFGDL